MSLLLGRMHQLLLGEHVHITSTKVCIQGGATTLYVSSYATEPVWEKCSLVNPARQFSSASSWLGGWMRGGMHFSKTGWVAYDDTYRVVAPPWMQALTCGHGGRSVSIFVTSGCWSRDWIAPPPLQSRLLGPRSIQLCPRLQTLCMACTVVMRGLQQMAGEDASGKQLGHNSIQFLKISH